MLHTFILLIKYQRTIEFLHQIKFCDCLDILRIFLKHKNCFIPGHFLHERYHESAIVVIICFFEKFVNNWGHNYSGPMYIFKLRWMKTDGSEDKRLEESCLQGKEPHMNKTRIPHTAAGIIWMHLSGIQDSASSYDSAQNCAVYSN